MKDDREQQLKNYLKQHIQPADVELRRDLWPAMLRRFDERASTVPWFDWALLGLVVALLMSVPGAIPFFLYHF